jgi:hypothetical protein
MKIASKCLMIVFFTLTFGLIVFCLLFGLPFVSKFAAAKVLAMAGCSMPSFDIQAICPAGSYAKPFIPLSHWLTTFLAPLVLIQNFGGMLIVWVAACFVAWLLWLALKSASDKVMPI